MKKSLFSRYMLGLAASVLATGFAAAQAKEPSLTKATASGVRLASATVDSSRSVRAAEPKTIIRKYAVETDLGSTLQYFHDLKEIVHDLRSNAHTGKTVTAGLKSTWMRKQAAKIDALSTLGVDPELTKVGEHIASSLYEAADSVTQTMGKSRVRQSFVPAHYDYYRYDDVYAFGPSYGGYSYGNERGYYDNYGYGLTAYGTTTIVAVPNSVSRVRQQLMMGQEDRLNAFNTARNALENAEKDIASVRRALTNQYGVEF